MELEITLKIEAPELVQAMENLAAAIAANAVKVADSKPAVENVQVKEETDTEPEAKKPRRRKSAKTETVKEEPADEAADKEAETEIKAKPEVEAEEQPEVDEEALREKLKHNLIEGNKKGIITKADMQAVLKKHGAKNLSALPIDALVATAKKFLGDDYDK